MNEKIEAKGHLMPRTILHTKDVTAATTSQWVEFFGKSSAPADGAGVLVLPGTGSIGRKARIISATVVIGLLKATALTMAEIADLAEIISDGQAELRRGTTELVMSWAIGENYPVIGNAAQGTAASGFIVKMTPRPKVIPPICSVSYSKDDVIEGRIYVPGVSAAISGLRMGLRLETIVDVAGV